MNKFCGVGRWTKDPEVRYSTGDNAMAILRGTIAIDRRVANKDGKREADFISCVAFGKTAEFIGKYFAKGQRIGIEGHIQTGSYVNKDGNTVYTTDVVIDNAEFVESKGSANTDTSVAPSKNDEYMNIPDDAGSDGLPF